MTSDMSERSLKVMMNITIVQEDPELPAAGWGAGESNVPVGASPVLQMQGTTERTDAKTRISHARTPRHHRSPANGRGTLRLLDFRAIIAA